MYSSSLIGRQWAAAIHAIDERLAEEVEAHGLAHMPEIDALLERRKRLADALFYSGELVPAPE
jgi:hypothetical protein